MQPFFAKFYVQVLIALVLLGALAALGAYANLTWKQARQGTIGPSTISISGEGEAVALPDLGQFSFSVVSEGDDAADAQSQSARSVNSIIDYLKAEGVEERDIKTQYYNLNPLYRYEERSCPVGSLCPPGDRVLVGFEANQTIAVKLRDLDKAGGLISGVGERGATNVSGLQFTIDDESILKAEARAAAIVDAKEKAEVLARDLDVRLVRIIGFWEDEGGYYGYGGDAAVSRGAMMESAAIAPDLPAGENTVRSRISITYEIR